MVSRKDQAQYWSNEDIPYSYVSVDKFVDMFQEFHAGQKLNEELSKPYNKSESDKNSLSFNKYSIRTTELFKACLSREWLLMKRNAFVYIFKSSQVKINTRLLFKLEYNSQTNRNCFEYAACSHCYNNNDSVHSYSNED